MARVLRAAICTKSPFKLWMQTAKNLQARVKSGCFLERLFFVTSLPHGLNSHRGQLDLVTYPQARKTIYFKGLMSI